MSGRRSARRPGASSRRTPSSGSRWWRSLSAFRAFAIWWFRAKLAPQAGSKRSRAASANGVRFDVLVATYALLLSLLPILASLFVPLGRWPERIRRALTPVVLALYALAFVTDAAYFTEYDDQFDHWIFGLIYDDRGAIATTIWKTYPVASLLPVRGRRARRHLGRESIDSPRLGCSSGSGLARAELGTRNRVRGPADTDRIRHARLARPTPAAGEGHRDDGRRAAEQARAESFLRLVHRDPEPPHLGDVRGDPLLPAQRRRAGGGPRAVPGAPRCRGSRRQPRAPRARRSRAARGPRLRRGDGELRLVVDAGEVRLAASDRPPGGAGARRDPGAGVRLAREAARSRASARS